MLKKAIITIITIIDAVSLLCGCGANDKISGTYYHCYTAEDGKSWEYDNTMYLELNNDNTGILMDHSKIFPLTWEKDRNKINLAYTDTVWGKTTDTTGEYFKNYYGDKDTTAAIYFAGSLYTFSMKE